MLLNPVIISQFSPYFICLVTQSPSLEFSLFTWLLGYHAFRLLAGTLIHLCWFLFIFLSYPGLEFCGLAPWEQFITVILHWTVILSLTSPLYQLSMVLNIQEFDIFLFTLLPSILNFVATVILLKHKPDHIPPSVASHLIQSRSQSHHDSVPDPA